MSSVRGQVFYALQLEAAVQWSARALLQLCVQPPLDGTVCLGLHDVSIANFGTHHILQLSCDCARMMCFRGQLGTHHILPLRVCACAVFYTPPLPASIHFFVRVVWFLLQWSCMAELPATTLCISPCVVCAMYACNVSVNPLACSNQQHDNKKTICVEFGLNSVNLHCLFGPRPLLSGLSHWSLQRPRLPCGFESVLFWYLRLCTTLVVTLYSVT